MSKIIKGDNGGISIVVGSSGFTWTFDSSGNLTIPATGSIINSSGSSGTTNANYVFAGPTSGLPAAPGYRALVASDIPTSLTSTTSVGASSGTLILNSPTISSGTNTSVSLLPTTASTINAFGAGTTITIGASTGTTTVNNNLIVTKDLTINGNLNFTGTALTINTSTITIDDKNIELGSVPSATISATGTIGSISGSGPWTATITNMTTTAGLIIGSSINATAAVGAIFTGSPTSVLVTSIVDSTSVTYTVTGGTTPIAGTVTDITTTGATNLTADGGGITLKGTTDKTIIWDNTNSNWTSSEHWNIASGKSFKINNVSVLNATTLGANVVNSSLTSVGTLTSLSVNSINQGNSTSTTDADAIVDASTTAYYSYIQSTSGTQNSIRISNLTAGRCVILYLRNTFSATKTINILAGTSTTYAFVNLSKGGGTSVTAVTLSATSGTATITVFNAGGVIGGSIA
jgi:hypothetical protein